MCIALRKQTSELQGVTYCMGSHIVTVLSTPARQTGTRFTYPGGIEGWVDLGGWLHNETVYSIRGVLSMGRTGLQPQAHSSDRPTRISKFFYYFSLKFFMFISSKMFSTMRITFCTNYSQNDQLMTITYLRPRSRDRSLCLRNDNNKFLSIMLFKDIY